MQSQGPDPQQVLSSEQAAERAAMEEAALPLMLDAMWAANVLDIESTVRSVCKKVTHTSSHILAYTPATHLFLQAALSEYVQAFIISVQTARA